MAVSEFVWESSIFIAEGTEAWGSCSDDSGAQPETQQCTEVLNMALAGPGCVPPVPDGRLIRS